eukprot:gene11738-11827_t
MKTVTLSVASREVVTRRTLAAFEGHSQGAHISFESAELLWSTLTRKRGMSRLCTAMCKPS